MSCENDETSTSETYNTADELLADLEKRLPKEKPKYKPLDKHDEELYQKSKIIIDNRKPAQNDIIQAYIIYSIRKEEDNEYIKEIAKAYKQNLEELIKLTEAKYKISE